MPQPGTAPPLPLPSAPRYDDSMSTLDTHIERLVAARLLERGRFLVEGSPGSVDRLRRCGLVTVRGKRHTTNDDFLHILTGVRFQDQVYDLFAVYDGVSIGMGRQMKGHRSSRRAAEAVHEFFRDFAALCPDVKGLLHAALDYANDSLRGQTNATTVVLAFVDEATGICYLGWVGDSRVCVVREDRVIPVNRLHRHPTRRNVITRKLGPDSTGSLQEERGDTGSCILVEGDVLVLASDGIEDVTDEQMGEALRTSSSLQEFVVRLARLGVDKGDDRTIIAVPA